jgi:hypothetical protein
LLHIAEISLLDGNGLKTLLVLKAAAILSPVNQLDPSPWLPTSPDMHIDWSVAEPALLDAGIVGTIYLLDPPCDDHRQPRDCSVTTPEAD